MLSVGVFVALLIVPAAAIPQSVSPISSTEAGSNQSQEKLKLEIQKLTLEVSELKRKAETPAIFKFFNEPLVTTMITLGVGGFIFGILSDRRTRRNKRLDEYVLMTNNVAGDLARVFTPFYQYIRHPSHRLDLPRVERQSESFHSGYASEETDEELDKKKILQTLHRRIPQLYERRLSVYVTAEAILPSKGLEFARRYFLICRDLQTVERQLRNESLFGNYSNDKIPQRIRQHARRDNVVPLKSPFNEFDQWVTGIWDQAHDLLAETLKHANLSNGSGWPFSQRHRRRREPLK